jgi:hypothetical protein
VRAALSVLEAGVIDPPMRTLLLAHPERKMAEEALGVGRFRRVVCRPEGPVGACRATVARRIRLSGGEAVGGWLVHHWLGLFIEALFHCFWLSPENEVIDLTQKYPGDPARFSTMAASAIPGFTIGPPSRHHLLTGAPEVRALLALVQAQAEHRLNLEARIFTRSKLQSLHGPLLGFATTAELAELERHESLVGRAIVACLALQKGVDLSC